jgi:GH24 family phage-related lysozyme (muramidase)
MVMPPNVNIVKKFEGFRDTPYTDPIGLAPLAMGICARPRAAQKYSRSYTILDPSIQICSA